MVERVWRFATIAVVAVVAPATACGGAAGAPAAAPPPVLPAAAVSYLPSQTATVTVVTLKDDAPSSDVASRIGGFGFVRGAERSFQGESRRLQVVVSRTLLFRTATGARAFVSFVGTHAGAYVGQVPVVRPLTSEGRRGVQITAPACACHMANPMLLGVVSSGPRVTWLEVNGPIASPRTLAALLLEAP